MRFSVLLPRRSVGWSYDRPTQIPPRIGGGGPTGLPRSAISGCYSADSSVGLASLPVDLDLRQEMGQLLYLWVKPITPFGLLLLTTVISDSRMLTLLPDPSSRWPGTDRRNHFSRSACHPDPEPPPLPAHLRLPTTRPGRRCPFPLVLARLLLRRFSRLPLFPS